MRATCNNTGKNVSITRDREYEIISETDSRFSLINDKGIEKNYAKTLFTVIPEVPPVEIINELNIETGVVLNAGNISFQVACPFIGRNRFNHNSGNIMQWQGTGISCGVYQIVNIDGFINNLASLRERFDTYMTEHSAVFVLNEDIDLDETFRDIYDSILQDLIAAFQGEAPRCGILLLSTTTNSINSNESFRDALDEVASSKVTTLNPNSRNEINVWSLTVEHE